MQSAQCNYVWLRCSAFTQRCRTRHNITEIAASSTVMASSGEVTVGMHPSRETSKPICHEVPVHRIHHAIHSPVHVHPLPRHRELSTLVKGGSPCIHVLSSPVVHVQFCTMETSATAHTPTELFFNWRNICAVIQYLECHYDCSVQYIHHMLRMKYIFNSLGSLGVQTQGHRVSPMARTYSSWAPACWAVLRASSG